MDTFSRADIALLLERERDPSVSIYLPTVVAGVDAQQNPLLLKNLLKTAREQLVARGVRAVAARELVAPFEDLIAQDAYWKSMSTGLALFATPDWHWCWRLPTTFKEFVWTGDHFYLKPLWSLANSDATYYLLAVSQNAVRLFRATAYVIEQVPEPALPGGLEHALNYRHSEAMVQAHTGQPAYRGKEGVVFHGQGGAADESKNEIRAYFRVIDKAVRSILGAESTPLVLAGVEYLLPIYREVNTAIQLVDVDLPGNPDYLTAHELHQRSLDLARPLLDKSSRQDCERYSQRSGSKLATHNIVEVVEAAHQGAVDALFVARDREIWGKLNSAGQVIRLESERFDGCVDLLDLAASTAFRTGGRVYSIPTEEMPGQTPVAALLRFEAPRLAV